MFRFSLRTFLIAVLLLGTVFGWLGNQLAQIRRQQHLLARINAAGGKVLYERDGKQKPLFQEPPQSKHWLRRFYGDELFAPVEHIWWEKPLPAAADLSFLGELQNVKTLLFIGPNVDDQVIAQIAQLPRLRELHLSRTSVTANGLAQLGPLQSLGLAGPDVTDTTLTRIEALPTIESLTLLDTSVTSQGIKPLAHLPKLQWLRCLRNKHLDGPSLETIGSLSNLRELEFIDSPVGDSGLVHLRQLQNLRRLVLHLCNVTDAGMPDIGALTQLEHLNLIAAKVTDTGVAELATLIHLKSLDLAATQVADAGVAHLKAMESLEFLNLDQTPITDAACTDLGLLTNLKFLDIHRTAITDAGLPALAGLLNLQILEAGPNVTDEGAEAFLAVLKSAPGFDPQNTPQIQLWSSSGLRVVGKN